MKYFRIKQLQYAYGYDQLQNLIDTGAAWTLEGSFGRAAMDALESGLVCYLPQAVGITTEVPYLHVIR